ncbi:MAG TPA: peptidylprolyl isomerase [Nevskiaceae bacterium]|nr:peptidylprolyl isomerase [Nevskiaceae bacterium]
MIAPRLARLAGRPLLHFLLLGAGLWWALGVLQPRTIVVRASDLDLVRTQWIRETGRAPTELELQAGRARAIDEELMVREALRLRLDRGDPVVRERLLANLEFLDGTTADSDPERRLEQARRLGMPARDPVTRRRLVQLMEARFASRGEPTPADLAAFLARHADRYAHPERRAFRQVFFSRDTRGARTHADAQAALDALSAGGPAAPRATGDAFLAGDAFPPMDTGTIATRLGAELADAVARAPTGRWVGPVASAWGEHLLIVDEVVPAAAATLDAVRTQVAYAALEAHEQAAVRAGLAGLRTRWRVEVVGS